MVTVCVSCVVCQALLQRIQLMAHFSGLQRLTRMMPRQPKPEKLMTTTTFAEFAQRADYSLLDGLQPDPQASSDGQDHRPRQVFSGHYVPVTPTPLPEPELVAHSPPCSMSWGWMRRWPTTRSSCGCSPATSRVAQGPMRPHGWATGYALSIYGTEYTQQCPFGTGNGYGDGRAISVFEGLFEGQRWELQLKGGGPTPYCRGADGRAVLRSSVREFLAQELMHALGVPTSRSLTLVTCRAPKGCAGPGMRRVPRSFDPDMMVNNPAAITTRVAPSFLRVGQLELFARRVRSQAHPGALRELQTDHGPPDRAQLSSGDQRRPALFGAGAGAGTPVPRQAHGPGGPLDARGLLPGQFQQRQLCCRGLHARLRALRLLRAV
jgi:hypothetical protein